MNINEIEQRRLLADNDQLKATVTFIANVLIDSTFTDDEKIELVGRAVGINDTVVIDGREVEEL